MSSNKRRVFVIGVGMTKFEKPGSRANWDYPDMAKEAVTKAIADAKIDYKLIDQAVVGYVYGDSTCGQRALYGVGLTGIPISNVNNNCSTGSTALYLAKQLVEGGISDCALALGFEKMERGSLKAKYSDRTNPMDQHMLAMMNLRGFDKAPPAIQLFGNAGREHMEKYGTTQEQLAKIALKNHKHSVNNPYSQFRDEYSLEDILKSPTTFAPLTKLQCCPTSDGSGAAILASEDFVHRHGLESQAVEILAMEMRTDFNSTFEDNSCIKVIGSDMTRFAVDACYKKTGLSAQDVQVIELHDCFSANELITYEALGLCKQGDAGKLIDKGDTTYGGKWVVNPSGGLISKGHPLGATGLAQCCELNWQLRGMAGPRQVKNAKIALQHNIGLGGAVVVTMYRLGFPEKFKPLPANQPNPAIDPSVISGSVGVNAVSATATAPSSVNVVFSELEKTIKANPELVKQFEGIYQFNLKVGNDIKSWVVDVKNPPGVVKSGTVEEPDCTLILDAADFIGMMTGTVNPQKLYMTGKLKIKGSLDLAMKLNKLQALRSKL